MAKKKNTTIIEDPITEDAPVIFLRKVPVVIQNGNEEPVYINTDVINTEELEEESVEETPIEEQPEEQSNESIEEPVKEESETE